MKNFKNWLRSDRVTGMSLMSRISRTQCVYHIEAAEFTDWHHMRVYNIMKTTRHNRWAQVLHSIYLLTYLLWTDKVSTDQLNIAHQAATTTALSAASHNAGKWVLMVAQYQHNRHAKFTNIIWVNKTRDLTASVTCSRNTKQMMQGNIADTLCHSKATVAWYINPEVDRRRLSTREHISVIYDDGRCTSHMPLLYLPMQLKGLRLWQQLIIMTLW